MFSDHDEVNPGGNISELISEEKVDLYRCYTSKNKTPTSDTAKTAQASQTPLLQVGVAPVQGTAVPHLQVLSAALHLFVLPVQSVFSVATVHSKKRSHSD